LRVYTHQPKEIKFTEFLVTKLSDKIQLNNSIHKASDKFMVLYSFVTDFSYIMDDLKYETITEDLITYGLELCRDASVQE